MMTASVTQNKLAPLVATESHDDVTEDDDVIRPIDKNDVDWYQCLEKNSFVSLTSCSLQKIVLKLFYTFDLKCVSVSVCVCVQSTIPLPCVLKHKSIEMWKS